MTLRQSTIVSGRSGPDHLRGARRAGHCDHRSRGRIRELPVVLPPTRSLVRLASDGDAVGVDHGQRVSRQRSAARRCRRKLGSLLHGDTTCLGVLCRRGRPLQHSALRACRALSERRGANGRLRFTTRPGSRVPRIDQLLPSTPGGVRSRLGWRFRFETRERDQQRAARRYRRCGHVAGTGAARAYREVRGRSQSGHGGRTSRGARDLQRRKARERHVGAAGDFVEHRCRRRPSPSRAPDRRSGFRVFPLPRQRVPGRATHRHDASRTDLVLGHLSRVHRARDRPLSKRSRRGRDGDHAFGIADGATCAV